MARLGAPPPVPAPPYCMHTRSKYAVPELPKPCGRPLDSILPSVIDHLSQLVLLGELSAQGTEIADRVSTSREKCFFGGERAIGLDSELERGEKRMGDLLSLSMHSFHPGIGYRLTLYAANVTRRS